MKFFKFSIAIFIITYFLLFSSGNTYSQSVVNSIIDAFGNVGVETSLLIDSSTVFKGADDEIKNKKVNVKHSGNLEKFKDNNIYKDPKKQEEILNIPVEDIKDAAAAENDFQKEDKAASPSIEDFIKSGNESFETKDYYTAIFNYTNAINIISQRADAYFNRGRAYTELNDYTNALNDYSKTIEIDPYYEKAYINRGFIYMENKDFEKAINDFNQCIQLNRNSSIAYYNLGAAYNSLGEKKLAVNNFQKAAQLGDSDSRLWLKSKGYSW